MFAVWAAQLCMDKNCSVLFKGHSLAVIDKPSGVPCSRADSRSLDVPREQHIGYRYKSVEAILHEGLLGDPLGRPWLGGRIVDPLPVNGSGLLLVARTGLPMDEWGGQVTWAFLCGALPSRQMKEGVLSLPLHGGVEAGAAEACGALGRRSLLSPRAEHKGGENTKSRWQLLRTARVKAETLRQMLKRPSTEASNSQNTLRSSVPRTEDTPVSLVQLSIRGRENKDMIRAHCAYGLKCPVLGDYQYTQAAESWSHHDGSFPVEWARIYELHEAFHSKSSGTALWMHRKSITFRETSSSSVTVASRLPHHMRQLMSLFGWEDLLSVDVSTAGITRSTVSKGFDYNHG